MATISENFTDFKTKFVPLNPSPRPKIFNLSSGLNMIPNLVQGKTNISDKKSKETVPDMYHKAMMTMIPDVGQYFNIIGKIGEGTFSKVYMATLKNPSGHENVQSHFALKYLLPIVKPGRIAKEIRILRDMKGESNVIPLHSVLFGDGHAVIVMPIVSHEKFSSYFQHLSPLHIRDYMKKLLGAVARIHQANIVHRDIKPANFLYDYKTGKCALVDFGLSQYESEIENGMRQITQKVSQNNRDSFLKVPKTSVTNLKSRVNLESHFIDLAMEKGNDESTASVSELPFSEITSLDRTLKRKNFEALEEMPAPDTVVKKFRLKTPHKIDETNSFMISPVTPESKKTVLSVVPETPCKKRSPMKELNFEIDCTVLSACMNFNQQFKTPVKNLNTNVSCLETPPKTVRQSNVAGFSATSIGQSCQNSLQDCNKTPIAPSAKQTLPPKKVLNFQDAPNLKSSFRFSDDEIIESCDCQQKDEVCVHCYHRLQEFFVPRAGTPGFRAPEVLLRAATQTCKIDIWSVGVVFVSILSGRYPFFRSVDDLTSLAEMTELFGSKKISNIASKMERTFVIDRKLRPKAPLREIVRNLRESLVHARPNKVKSLNMPEETYDLLDRLLDPDPDTRFTAAQALQHPFFSDTLQL